MVGAVRLYDLRMHRWFRMDKGSMESFSNPLSIGQVPPRPSLKVSEIKSLSRLDNSEFPSFYVHTSSAGYVFEANSEEVWTSMGHVM